MIAGIQELSLESDCLLIVLQKADYVCQIAFSQRCSTCVQRLVQDLLFVAVEELDVLQDLVLFLVLGVFA